MLVYVSGPYTDHATESVERNINDARRVAIELWERGHVALCPHLNTAHFEQDCACTYGQYLEGDLALLARCDAIVMLPRWSESKGARRELDYALRRSILVYYCPELPPVPEREVRYRAALNECVDIAMRAYRDFYARRILKQLPPPAPGQTDLAPP